MVQFQKYLRQNNDYGHSKHLPMLNSLFVEKFNTFNPYSRDNDFKTFMKWARRSPQILGLLNIIATDILSDRAEFKPLGDRSSGKITKAKAEAFWIMNQGNQVAEETIYDFLWLGIGYNWIGKIDDSELKEFCDLSIREVFAGREVKELEFKSDEMYRMIKNNRKYNLVKKLRHIAASTMSMRSDAYNVTSYIQRIGHNQEEFSPEEIIVFKFMPFDGKVWPFPPAEALLAEVYLLWLISQNYISYFENGGKPDNVFILPEEIAKSKNHEYLIETLMKYKKIQNKHGQLVFTGNLKVEQLMKEETQMQHKDLGLYLTSVLAMFYGVPVNRIPFLIGKAAAGGDAGGLADSGYWRKISVWQRKFEEPYDRQLWIPYFNGTREFRRGYLQDEVRETQNEMQKTTIAHERIDIGLWTMESAGDYLGIDPEEVEAAQAEKKKRDQEIESSMLRQNLQNNGNVIPNQDARVKAKQKQTTQNNNQINAGGKKINP